MPSSGLLAVAVMGVGAWSRGAPSWTARGRVGECSPLLLEPEARLEQELDLAGGGAPHGAALRVVFGLDHFAELAHRGVLGGGCRELERLRPDVRGLARRDVRPLEPATDLVPVLVEEHDDGDGLVPIVQERVAE